MPNSVAVGPDGDYYVGELTGFPFPQGGAPVYRVPVGGGDPGVFAEGFTNIIDVAFGLDGSLYVLERFRNGLLSVDPINPATLEGQLTRISADGTREVVANAGLAAPTGVTVGDDGTIYVSILGVLPDAGLVIRLDPAASQAGTLVSTSPTVGTPMASPVASPAA